MGHLIQTLREYTTKSTTANLFCSFHKKLADKHKAKLSGFLDSTMDEVRLRNASEYSKAVLALSDNEDLDHFRLGLLRRETNGAISYAKQRDHSVHTLYNYLLGWYFYDASEELRDILYAKSIVRGAEPIATEEDKAKVFGRVWPFVSIVHDLGYLFEGSLSPLSTEDQTDLVSIGASVVQEYFKHTFWVSNKFDSTAERDVLLRLSDMELIDFSNRTFSGIADSLRNVGDIECLRKNILKQRGESVIPCHSDYDVIAIPGGLSSDAFDLWEANYSYYNNDSMVMRIKKMREIFVNNLQDGIDNTGLRMLDHGICSGLLLLLYSTFFNRLYFGFPRETKDEKDKYLLKNVREKGLFSGPEYKSLWWWSDEVRATACTAMHNIPQVKLSPKELKLSLEEEPLGYLGILVDSIQEWDRTTVLKESIIGGSLPTQGIDYQLSTNEGKVKLSVPTQKFGHIVDALDSNLNDWKRFLQVVELPET